jgi:hypothetical protein
MNRYGQAITWSTIAAPHLFTGFCTSYSYREQVQRQLMDDEGGDNVALALHSKKAELNFSANITSESTDFLDLSAGAAITVTGISAGVVLATRAVESWRLGQRKTASVSATHFPDMVQASPVTAGTDLDAVTPASQAQAFVYPGGQLIYGTAGLTHAVGIVHEFSIEQQLTITEDEPSPAGTILGAAAHGYLRTIRLGLLSTGAIPAVKSVLTVSGAPDHAADYRIESAELRFEDKRGKMFDIGAVWIPPFSS